MLAAGRQAASPARGVQRLGRLGLIIRLQQVRVYAPHEVEPVDFETNVN
jgi:hypothetical protein